MPRPPQILRETFLRHLKYNERINMKTLLKNGIVVNVFTDELQRTNVLLENEKIVGVGDYCDNEADVVEDVSGKFICPGFIDGHIHIESTMLTPAELSRLCVANGTTSIIADPHEITNVCGADGVKYMLEASKGLPMDVFVVLPSCVPASGFDEAGAVLEAEDIKPLYSLERVIGLGEMMNYPGVIFENEKVLAKIRDCVELGKPINGHAPLLGGKDLDKYISKGIYDDHECSLEDEAKERIRKGQTVMVRRGSAARNLKSLISLFDEPWNRRCMLVTDDCHPDDLIKKGHINSIIREAVSYGKSAIVGIRMATIQAAKHFKLDFVGAIAPGYKADVVVFDNLCNLGVTSVYKNGERVVENGKCKSFAEPCISPELVNKVKGSFNMKTLSESDFTITPEDKKCRVIKVVPRTLITDEMITEIDFTKNNGIDIERDILKIAVIERHKNTGHIGLGFINGLGLKKGAIASSVSHDSHNLIVVGVSASDMTAAANRVKELGGGYVLAVDGKIVSELPLPIGGIMTDASAEDAAKRNKELREIVCELGVNPELNPFMNMAFVALSVIPHLKMTTFGLVDVDKQKLVSTFLED